MDMEKGTKKIAYLFTLKNIDVIKAASITDHQGKNWDKTNAIMIVAKKFTIFLFIIQVKVFVWPLCHLLDFDLA